MQRIKILTSVNIKVFSASVFLILSGVLVAREIELNDEELLEIAKSAFAEKFSVKNQKLGIEGIRRALEPLDDAQKTRAMMLRIFDLDARDGGRMRPNPSSSVTNHLLLDPSLIEDPTELKRMLAEERDPRRFYILSALASHFMSSKKIDFVKEISPMLFRKEPLAKMHGEYYVHSLTNSAYFSYDLIVKNLKLVSADFIPPAESLPYEERIPILIEWLRENWPGCENLGADVPTRQKPTFKDAQGTDFGKPGSTAKHEEEPFPTSLLWWLLLPVTAGFLVMLGMLWKRG